MGEIHDIMISSASGTWPFCGARALAPRTLSFHASTLALCCWGRRSLLAPRGITKWRWGGPRVLSSSRAIPFNCPCFWVGEGKGP